MKGPAGDRSPRRKPNLGLSRDQRLVQSRLIREAFDQRNKAVGRYMVLWTRQSGDADSRLAVISSRKVGGAVQRNRARRRLREVFRLHRHLLQSSADVVIVARRALLAASWPDVTADFMRVAKKAGLLEAPAS